MLFLFFSCSQGSLTIEEANKLIDERHTSLCACMKEITATEANDIVLEKQSCIKQYELSSGFRLDLEKRIVDLKDEDQKKIYTKVNGLNSKKCE